MHTISLIWMHVFSIRPQYDMVMVDESTLPKYSWQFQIFANCRFYTITCIYRVAQNGAILSHCKHDTGNCDACCQEETIEQRVQNAAARLVLNLGFRDHVTSALQQLHRLPVEYRIKYKLCALMYQIHTGRAPQYLVDSVQSVAESSRRPGLRSTNTANAALVRSLVNVASAMLVQLPGTLYLPAL